VLRSHWVDPAVYVMPNVVLSQQNESRELLTARIHSSRRGTHLREQVQDSVAHGTGGVSRPIDSIIFISARPE
jgi:hypothetical protein